jgi:hypothetical protein
MENDFLNQAKEELTEYGRSVGEVGKLRLVGIISRVLGLFLLILTIVLCALAVFTFAAVAIIDILSEFMSVWAASLIVGSTYLILLLVAILCRRPLFINPFIALLTKQIKTEEELRLKTIEAEHQVEVQQVRMTCQVENVVREFDFYVSLFSRIRQAIKRLLSLKKK